MCFERQKNYHDFPFLASLSQPCCSAGLFSVHKTAVNWPCGNIMNRWKVFIQIELHWCWCEKTIFFVLWLTWWTSKILTVYWHRQSILIWWWRFKQTFSCLYCIAACIWTGFHLPGISSLFLDFLGWNDWKFASKMARGFFSNVV